MIYKDYKNWHLLKTALDECSRTPSIEERGVWWCSIGVNVGFESDGKGEKFRRPVVILKKYGAQTFMAVPLTTKVKDVWYHYPMMFQGKKQAAMLTQLRLMDTKRLGRKMGKLSPNTYKNLKEAVLNVL